MKSAIWMRRLWTLSARKYATGKPRTRHATTAISRRHDRREHVVPVGRGRGRARCSSPCVKLLSKPASVRRPEADEDDEHERRDQVEADPDEARRGPARPSPSLLREDASRPARRPRRAPPPPRPALLPHVLGVPVLVERAPCRLVARVLRGRGAGHPPPSRRSGSVSPSRPRSAGYCSPGTFASMRSPPAVQVELDEVAEELDEDDLALGRVQAGGRGSRSRRPHGRRPDRDDAPGRRRRAGRRGARTLTLDVLLVLDDEPVAVRARVTLPRMMLLSPMNRATSSVAGLVAIVSGSAICWIRASFMTTMRSAIDSASSWLCVTWMNIRPS